MAIGTLTALPVRPPVRVTRRSAGQAMLSAPLAVVPLAAVAALVTWTGSTAGLGPWVCVVLALGAVQLLSRGLHLDGLADTADGLAASYDRERALDVMRRGDVGPAGVAAVGFVVLAQVAAGAQLLAAASETTGAALIGVCVVLSRVSVAVGCVRGIPTARSSGLGATVAGTVPRLPLVVELLLLTSLAALVVRTLNGTPWWSAPAATVAVLVVTAVLLGRCVRRLGGVTGDVLGAVVEVSLAAALVTVAATS
ncbi:MAG: adenosylcobinamide-GDP ribazoletransferase [Propionibacteriales bacterium]|nr:adenosylcobinamide-GDP ribazoletransferase [Propionibacteriales bacterium]